MKVDLKKLEKAYGSILKVDIAGKVWIKEIYTMLHWVMLKQRKRFMQKHPCMQESI